MQQTVRADYPASSSETNHWHLLQRKFLRKSLVPRIWQFEDTSAVKMLGYCFFSQWFDPYLGVQEVKKIAEWLDNFFYLIF